MIGTCTDLDAAVTRDNTIPIGALALQGVCEFQHGDLRGLGPGGGVSFIDRRAAGTAVSTFNLPEYAVLNLVSYYKVTPDVRVHLNVDNLFDRTYYDRGFGNRYALPGAPLTVTGGFAARF